MADQKAQNEIEKAKTRLLELDIKSPFIKDIIDYIEESLQKQPFFDCLPCFGIQTGVNPAFCRALRTLNKEEKIAYYIQLVSILQKRSGGISQLGILGNEEAKVKNFNFFNEKEGKWQLRRVKLDYSNKSIEFTSTHQIVDLHHYVLRCSKKKDRKALALQSTQDDHIPETIRISNYKQSFEQLQNLLRSLLNSAMIEKISKWQKSSQGLRSSDFKDKANSTNKLLSNINSSTTLMAEPLNESKTKKSRSELITTLKSIDHLNSTILADQLQLQENVVRKKYESKDISENIPLEWFADNLMNPSGFYNWKSSLKDAKTINSKMNTQQSRCFLEKHQFQGKVSLNYMYIRQKLKNTENKLMFLDTNLSTQTPTTYLGLQSDTNIEYIVWQFSQSDHLFSITIQAKIFHGQTICSALSKKFTNQFLGDINLLIEGIMKTSHTVIFDDLYSIYPDSLDLRSKQSFFSIDNGRRASIQSLTSKNQATSSNRVSKTNKYARIHLQQPEPKDKICILKKPRRIGMNPFVEEDFQLTDQGLLICTNKKKLDIQNGLLKKLLKSVLSKLSQGKSLLQISLPVQMFMTESHLSMLCKSLCYAPLTLEKAAQEPDSVNRMKYIVAFALGLNNAYLTMEKPFNPILGQTYQCLIDGCPVYGEQISHHPPISSILMKGRGYTVYGSLESWVGTGVNSVSGGNKGIVTIDFSNGFMAQNRVKFVFPPFELKGFLFGKRTFKTQGQALFLDERDRLLLELNISHHKGLTQFCRFENGVEGQILQLRSEFSFADFPNCKYVKEDVEKQLGMISGKWTDSLYFEQEEIINYCKHFPHVPEQYQNALPSNSKQRRDLVLFQEGKIQEAQQAKELMEALQRNDRQLRNQHKNNMDHERKQ